MLVDISENPQGVKLTMPKNTERKSDTLNQSVKVVSTPTEEMELSDEELESLQQFGLHSEPIPLSHVEFIAQKQLSKVLSNLPTEQEIRESERKEIGEWLELCRTQDRSIPDWYCVVYDEEIAKLKSGQSPKEV
jgi:hypothetical protein